MLLQLEAPIRIGVVLRVQPLDALAEAGRLRFGQEALQVPLTPPHVVEQHLMHNTNTTKFILIIIINIMNNSNNNNDNDNNNKMSVAPSDAATPCGAAPDAQFKLFKIS
jgi:hypothetical protein